MDDEIREKRIMVVDDEEDLILFYRLSLEYYEFKVATYNNPRNVLSDFKADYYDLVILDIKMPDMDGFELYTKMKEIDPRVEFVFLQRVSFIIKS